MKLYSRTNGEGENALIILPGLLGSSANWQSIAKRLGQQRCVYTLDLRNHGQSPWSDIMSYDSMANDVAEFIATLDHIRISLLGHSMGGKVAMRLGLKAPELIDTLIAADIAPVRYAHDFDDLITAMMALDVASFDRRADGDAALQATVPSPQIRAFLLHNLSFDKASEAYHWRPNLKVLLDSMPHITGFDLAEEEFFAKPALFIHGANSDYVTADNRAIIQQHFRHTRFVALQHAGHWLHVEQPRAFIKSCETFLSHDY